MAEYIKLEFLRDEILNNDFDCDTVNYFLGIVDSQPVVDVVEVVRCKDCEHRKEVPDCQKELYSSSCVACSYHSGLRMTFREANNMIDDISWFYGGESITTDDIVECREICHKALEKQIPKKPEKSYDGYADGNPVIEYHCPNCYREVDEDELEHYCHCGQALDWSDTE